MLMYRLLYFLVWQLVTLSSNVFLVLIDMKNSFLHINLLIVVIVISIMAGSIPYVKAQQSWGLTKCVNYAIDHNIELNQKNNKITNQQINVLESKANILPDLNIGSGVNINFGRNIDGNTNAITYNQTLNNSYWIESSIDIFQGLVRYNTIGFNNFLLRATKQEALYAKNKLIFSVLTSYYTALYSTGLQKVAKNQVVLSQMQLKRMQRLVDVGKESPITVQELKSQWAKDKLSLTRAKNNTSKTLLGLKQLLRLDANQLFEIDTLNISSLVISPIPSIDSVFKIAVNNLPEIKQQEYLLMASEKDLAVAKGTISPRLYVSAGFATNYFDGDTLGYKTQINNNQNQRINMGIVIPVFNNASTYSKIKRKQIAIKNSELQLEKRREDLYTEIWKAVDDLQSAENEYKSSVELYGFSELTLQNTTKKMEKGLASTTDFEVAKQRFISAEAGLLKAKLVYVMRKQMLEFYQTGSWGHL